MGKLKSKLLGARTTVLVGAAVLVAALSAPRQTVSDKPDTPFKLATFEANGRPAVGLVLGERIYGIPAASAYVSRKLGLEEVSIPNEMRRLIEDYDRVAPRLYQMANAFSREAPAGEAFAFDVQQVHLKAPIKYPYNLLAAAANYRTHAAEMSVESDIDPDRDAPYFFAKSPRSCIADPGQPFIIPRGRDKIDWEGEFAVVIGKEAYEVSLEKAMDVVFGFTIMYDVSDRGGQKRAHPTFPGPDWFSGKSRKGAAPMGPYIVPKEFLPNFDHVRLVTRVNGVVKQEGNTKDLIYDVPHIVGFITSIMPLWPGDVISTGSPAGVGAARKPPEFLKPGDVVTVEVEGIGTLETPIKAASSAPTSEP